MTRSTLAQEIAALVRTEFRTLDPRELLRQPPTSLLGISAAAAAALAQLEIRTVFDLATAKVFDDAAKLAAVGEEPQSALAQFGTPPADMVREALIGGKTVEELRFQPIAILQAIPDNQVGPLSQALDVQLVRDLALYPPYRAASRILEAVFFPENEPTFDPDAPPDLIPKAGEYPTERVQYTTLLMDEIKLSQSDTLLDVTSATFQPVSLDKLAQMSAGFKRIAYGALLTFNQSWYAQGVTLGQLLHSVALAPGESTRIAVIDWTRKSRAGETEVISEVDDLTNDTTQNRAISEVTEAVADEAQGGFSSTNTKSRSKQSGEATATDFSAPLGGLLGGPSGSVATSSSRASSASSAESYSSSWGHRNIGSTMMQNVNDRTHQHAHSSRSRRASVVKEVAQSEHEQVSTRVLANYNHMHALTIQYYEVVQLYRVEVSLARADRVIFIPLDLIDFNKDDTIRTFRTVLARVALASDIRETLRNLDVIEIEPDLTARFAVFNNSLPATIRETVVRRRVPLQVIQRVQAVEPAAATAPPETSPVLKLERALPPIERIDIGKVRPAIQLVNEHLWEGRQIARLANLLDQLVLRPGSNAIYLPADVIVEDVTVEDDPALKAVCYRRSGGLVDINPDTPLLLAELDRIAVSGSNATAEVTATVTLTLNRGGVHFPLELPGVRVAQAMRGETRLVQITPGGVNINLKQHLNANKLYYSQAIFRSLDTTQLAVLLSGLGVTVNGKVVPVAQVVEPRPIRVVGNYLAFRMNSDATTDSSWAQWLTDHGIQVGSSKYDLVPLGTGGTFAEAVLGRFNCAEKLDITRFWNWQDSPIPLQPTEIAAIQTGSRQAAEDVKPGQLSTPIINITQPASLPDPVGTAAILAAVQNGNMFRDMSGLQATVGLAQAALQATAAGAASAGQQAGTNQKNQLEATTERQRIAADMIKDLARTATSAFTGMPAGGGGGGPAASNHSQDGAKINYFDKTKEPAPSSGNDNGGGPVTPAQGGSSTPSSVGGGTRGSDNGSNGNGAGGGQYSQNPAALAATWGDSQPRSNLLNRVLDIAGTDTSSPAGSANSPWRYLDEVTVMDRLNVLRKSPNLIDQGALGLCGEATFIRHIIQRDPVEFRTCATMLFYNGVGLIGDLKIDPDSDLLNANYGKIVSKRGNKYPPIPPQADWMILSALRDSQNEFLDYEGTPEEDFADGSDFSERVDWYKKSNRYTSVVGDKDTSLNHVKTITKTTHNHISMRMDARMIQPGNKGKHIISLESSITIDEANDKVTFDYWTWGNSGVQTCTTTVKTFQECYFGAIIAEF
jgi:hypothetical protein